jgi:negative regulator of sigma E activity
MKIIEYLEGQMSFDEKLAFEQELKDNQELNAEFSEYSKLYSELGNIEIEKPSITLKSNFEHLLDAEIKKQQKPTKILTLKNIRSAAAIAAILVIGILVGQNWTQRDFISNMDKQTAQLILEMNQNMNSTSVSGRIEAVQVSQKFENPKSEVINTLIKTLKTDESPNVRLAAAEALDRYATKADVRAAFVTQLSSEKDPFVLIALINTLSEQKERKAIDPLENLTNAKDIAKFIKDEAHMGLIKIEKI